MDKRGDELVDLLLDLGSSPARCLVSGAGLCWLTCAAGDAHIVFLGCYLFRNAYTDHVEPLVTAVTLHPEHLQHTKHT